MKRRRPENRKESPYLSLKLVTVLETDIGTDIMHSVPSNKQANFMLSDTVKTLDDAKL